MENASKALIIAGETLIAILVLSLIVYTTTVFGKFSANMNKKLDKNKQIDFNNRFLQYERKIDITADDIVSTINFAKQTNDSNELFLSDGYDNISQSPYFVDVWAPTQSGGIQSFFKNLTSDKEFQIETASFLKQHTMDYFSCSVSNVTYDLNSYPGKIELKPNLSGTGIEIDDSEGGTQLVKKIIFKKFPGTTTGTILDYFNMQNKDLFIIN